MWRRGRRGGDVSGVCGDPPGAPRPTSLETPMSDVRVTTVSVACRYLNLSHSVAVSVGGRECAQQHTGYSNSQTTRPLALPLQPSKQAPCPSDHSWTGDWGQSPPRMLHPAKCTPSRTPRTGRTCTPPSELRARPAQPQGGAEPFPHCAGGQDARPAPRPVTGDRAPLPQRDGMSPDAVETETRATDLFAS